MNWAGVALLLSLLLVLLFLALFSVRFELAKMVHHISFWLNTKRHRTLPRGRVNGNAMHLLAFVLMAVAATAGIIKLLDRTTEASYWYLPHVTELMPDNQYVVLHLDKNDPLYGQKSLYTFCPESSPIPFSEGQLITWIKYREKQDCKQIIKFNLDRNGIQATDHKEAP